METDDCRTTTPQLVGARRVAPPPAQQAGRAWWYRCAAVIDGSTVHPGTAAVGGSPRQIARANGVVRARCRIGYLRVEITLKEGRRIRSNRRLTLILLLIPLATAVAVTVHIHGRVASEPDSGVFIGLAHNVREHGSLTSPADPVWLLQPPAVTAARKGFIPIPDFAPVYPVLGAGADDPVRAFTIVGVIAAFLAVAAAGTLVRMGTRSTLAGLAVQVVVVVGPLSKLGLLPRITFLDLGSVIQSDVLALGFFLTGLCALLWTARDDRARFSVLAGLIFAAAALTRYAYLGAVLGTALVLLVRWLRTREQTDRRNLLATASASIAAPAWMVCYQIATSSGPAKQFHVHFKSVAIMGRVMAGWFGPDIHSTTVGTGVVLLIGVGLGVLTVFGKTSFTRLCAGAAFGYFAVQIFTVQFLDTSYAFAAERTLVLIRVLLLAIVADTIVRRLRIAGNRRLLIVTMATFVAWLALWGDAPFSTALAQPWSASSKARMNPSELPLLANLADDVYSQLRQPAVELPSAVEDSTGSRRNVQREAVDLVGVLRQQGPRFLVLISPSFVFQGLRQNQWPACTTTRNLKPVAGIQRYELDLTRCPPRSHLHG